MSASHPLALVPSVAAIAFVIAAPDAIEAQMTSARPAAVSLTVVVPPRPRDVNALAIDERAKIVARSSTVIDLEKMVGLSDRPASRIEVRRGADWAADAPRVWVQNPRGEFEPLDSGSSVVAFDAPGSLAKIQSALRFRVEADRADASLALPVEYRITVGEGDQIAVWRFTSVIRPDSLRSHTESRADR
jgi:hypothetical protein